MKTGQDFADCALLAKWDKFKYSQLDCQAFVEAVLKDIGVRKPDGKPYDWRGSNAMYRNYYSWRGSVEECIICSQFFLLFSVLCHSFTR